MKNIRVLLGTVIFIGGILLTACSSSESGDGDSDDTMINITLNETTIKCDSAQVDVDGETATINSGGIYNVSGNLTDGMIIVDSGKTDDVEIVLDNACINNSSDAAIYVKKAQTVTITLKDGSENSLSCTDHTSSDDKVDGCIYSRADLTVTGSGKLQISASEGHGIVSKNSLVVESGTLSVDAGEDAFNAGGDLCVKDGTITITAGDDGIHSDSTTSIENGDIKISESAEGIEGSNVVISGGAVELVSSDDGINAAGDDGDHSVSISGGNINIKASGDGIDSNGSLLISGGDVYISGSEGSGNGALDYDTTGQITGGRLIAVGNSGMAMNMDNTSTQGSIIITTERTYDAGTEIKVTDSDGNVIIEYTSLSSFNSVVASTLEMVKGGTYTIITGDDQTSVTLEDITNGQNAGMNNRPVNGMPGNGGRQDGGFKPDGNTEFDPNSKPDGKMRPEDGEKPDAGARPEDGTKPV